MTRYLVKCNKCGVEHKTCFWKKGDIHKKDECGGEFEVVKEIEGVFFK